MVEVLRRITWPPADPGDRLAREWLVTNGLGGYASGTLAGALTRRYHGLLIAALPAPFGRIVMLNHLVDAVLLDDGRRIPLADDEFRSDDGTRGADALVEFRLEWGLPVWRFAIDGLVLERRVHMPHLQNTVHVGYQIVEGDAPVTIELRPFLHFRPHEAPVSASIGDAYTLSVSREEYEIAAGGDRPVLRIRLHGPEAPFVSQPRHAGDVRYALEARRGYDSVGALWSPGFFRTLVAADRRTTLVASTEPWETLYALTPDAAVTAESQRRRLLLAAAAPAAQRGLAAELVLAADHFVIAPAGRAEESVRARAAGDQARTVIAGYHWFTDWGRDTMISLEGLTCVTGRFREAGYILRTFGHYVRHGLIPNLFPEGEREGLYHTADATLWYFHALDRYLHLTGDRVTLDLLLPGLMSIVDHHVQGTRFGIGVDARDGLLRQGADHLALTWMDAKVGDWVVTPRRGKAVEINALWYNALMLLAGWLDERERQDEAAALRDRAATVRASFNARFWFDRGGYLYDVVDGEPGVDEQCRPNQLLAISLAHPVLDQERWPRVLAVVAERLGTPVGLRTLSSDQPDYRRRYDGDLRARDAAYHQGTSWAWLAGPFVDAWLKAHPDDVTGAARVLEGFEAHLDQACIGTISEIFDAEAPFTPRGCIAQAWSVAEVLRCLVHLNG